MACLAASGGGGGGGGGEVISMQVVNDGSTGVLNQGVSVSTLALASYVPGFFALA